MLSNRIRSFTQAGGIVASVVSQVVFKREWPRPTIALEQVRCMLQAQERLTVRKRGPEISNKRLFWLLPGKIQVSALWVRAHQFDLKLIAHIHTQLTTSEEAFRGRV